MALDAGKVVAVLELDTTAFSGGIKTAQSLMKQLQDDSTSLSDKMAAVGKAMEDVGSKLTKTLTLPTVAAGAAATAVFTSYDDSIRQVYATMALTAETGASDMEALSQAAQEAGATTRYTAGEAASALNYLALAGYDTNKAISTLPTVLRLAQAGGIDLARASDMVTDSMAALGIETERVDEFVDQMAKTSQKSNTSVAQLGEGILTIGSTAAQLAGGTVELNTALGILADNGIKGAEGGTHLRNILIRLMDPTADAAKMMETLGLSVYDADGKLRGIDEIFGDLGASMEGMTDAEKNMTLTTLFNGRDLAAAGSLLANIGDRWDELSGYIENSDGTAAQMAETMEGGIGGSFRNLKSAVEGLAIEFGENLAPTVQLVAEKITELTRGFAALPEGTQDIIVWSGMIVTAIGPVSLAVGKLIGLLTGPFGLPLAVMGAGAALAALDNALNQSSSAAETLKSAFQNADPEQAKGYFNSIRTEVDGLSGDLEALGRQFDALSGSREFRMVKAGAATDAETVGKAFAAADAQRRLGALDVREKAAAKRSEARAAWDAGKIDTAGLQAQMAAIDEETAAMMAQVEADYISNLNALFQGIGSAAENADVVAMMRGLADDLDMAAGLQALADQLMAGLDEGMDEAGRGRLLESINKYLFGSGMGEGFEGMTAEDVLAEFMGDAGWASNWGIALSGKADELTASAEEAFRGADKGGLGAAINAALEAGMLDGIESLDTGLVQDSLRVALGNIQVPDTGIGSAVTDELEKAGGAAPELGVNLAQGFIDGMDKKLQGVINKAKQLARAAITAVERETDQHSPSRVAHKMGAFFGQGFEEGIYSKVTDVMAASAHMARASVNGLSDYRASTSGATRVAPAAAAAGGAAGGGSNMAVTLNVNNPVVRDGNDVARLSRDINRYTAQLARGYGGR